jgi:predicted glycogen debranching enzyme
MDKDRCLAHEESLAGSDEKHFALFTPLAIPEIHHSYTMELSVFNPGGCEHVRASLFFLSKPADVRVKNFWQRSELMDKPLLFLGTNGRGGMLRALVDWGNLQSHYDALLAGNLNLFFPEDRRILFSRCRAWIVFQGYSQEISFDCFDSFRFDYHSNGSWCFQVPCGQGEHISLWISVEMIRGKNEVRIQFFRESGTGKIGRLSDTESVQLILRPDIEDRNFHEITKAYQGPENLWPASVSAGSTGFVFAPSPKYKLYMEISRGTFVQEPEWHYMIYRSSETTRGLDPYSDLFSPGYFSVFLNGNETVELAASPPDEKDQTSVAWNHSIHPEQAVTKESTGMKPKEALEQALDHYVVRRDNLRSVIAGYPWFLDWGRDSLIFTRGLIASGNTQTAREIIKLFGQFENKGTIPNMIRGRDAGNRDTTDAPLWFLVVCADLVRFEGTEDFLDEYCGNRTFRQILLSIGNSLSTGTPNGIRMDPKSCLLFSPSHFTWMDTNHPAGTPRQGYPIEIQALWFAGLKMLSRIDPGQTKRQWKKTADRLRKSIFDYFLLEDEGYLSDCLHAGYGEPAQQAVSDDALRPNQLFAITLDAVTDPVICRNILSACDELLVPGAVRSLADRPVRHPIEIQHHGTPLNDPYHPYWGKYRGDEDTNRKPAYHNGTAWTWLLPTFCEAWIKTYGEAGKDTALAWLTSMVSLMNSGCAGHIPEILDGDFPHAHRGCDAQAWSASELLRVWLLLDGNTKIK